MTPEEMRAHAEKRKAQGSGTMMLVLMRSQEPGGLGVRLPMGGPVGEIASTMDNPDGRTRVCAWFDCDEILTWLAKCEAMA